ncbi:MAG: AMP-binding protein [Dehalococcoidia bacterium]|nr:AMP-binding protein [Dehalococcoidia bacterium]
MGPDVFRFFHALGVNLKQIYGQTEINGIAVVHRDGDIKFQTVGHPIPETDVRIDASGGNSGAAARLAEGYLQSCERLRASAMAGCTPVMPVISTTTAI